MAAVRESSSTEIVVKSALRGVLTSRVLTRAAAKGTPLLLLAAPIGGRSGFRPHSLAMPRVWSMVERHLTGQLGRWRATLVGAHVVAAARQNLTVRPTLLLWM